MDVRRWNRRSRAVMATGAMVLALLVGVVTPAGAVDITSSGPLTTVGVTPELRCSANHVGDTSGEFFGGTSCGTFISIDATLFGWLGTGFTPVSQTGPTGSGTNADPWFSHRAVVPDHHRESLLRVQLQHRVQPVHPAACVP